MRYCGSLRKDMNGDGIQSISDLWAVLWHIFHYPGDSLVGAFAGQPKYAAFFEITPASCGGLVSSIISIACWLFLLSLINAIDRR